MTSVVYVGGAGCGKTHNLMKAIDDRLRIKLLEPHQKILALTFMHGSRRRLEARFANMELYGTKVDCTVVDRFAAQILQRWRGLARDIGLESIEAHDHDGRCDAAGRLLEESVVRLWVASEYPIVLVDEAQDLIPQRLRILEAIRQDVDIYAAADDFQCLNENHRPSPVIGWANDFAEIIELDQIHRTNKVGLLEAAQAVRARNACPKKGNGFDILAARGAGLCAFFIAMTLGTRRWGTCAILTPTMNGYVKGVINRVGEKPIGARRSYGPYHATMEVSNLDMAAELLSSTGFSDPVNCVVAANTLFALPNAAGLKRTIRWLQRQTWVVGRNEVTLEELSDVLSRNIQEALRYNSTKPERLIATTINGAKNREFDGVIVIWPFAVGGDDEHKRRLLYNAITRAKQWCVVILQNERQLEAVPFISGV